MIRQLSVVAVIAGVAVSTVPAATADPPDMRHYDSDVPGMNYDASLGAPCFSWERFIFGRGPGGETLACHFIPNQWGNPDNGYWVSSPPLNGVQQVGAPCPDPLRGHAAAQSPDGLPMLCTQQHGWQPGLLIGGAGPYAPPGFIQPGP